MIIWVDTQMSPSIASWISANFSVQAMALRDLGLRDATDREIFLAARQASALIMTKDNDFLRLVHELGTPPKVIWITFGNTSNVRLKQILSLTLQKSIELLESGEELVEISSI